MSLLVTNIQRFSLYDGPGIRTTVFLKGCPLKCPWCCNPENINDIPEFYFNKNECIKTEGISCDKCVKSCELGLLEKPENILENNKLTCLKCKKCILACPKLALGIYGEEISTEDLINLIEKDKDYYTSSSGGVTFSGGEPLMQASDLRNCLAELKKREINIAIETSLFAPSESLKLIEDLVDVFIIDIKILDAKKCLKIMECDLKNFITNVEKILNGNKRFIFRFPVVKGFTYNKSNINALYSFITKYNLSYLEIFNAHNLSCKKYQSLNLKVPKIEKITEEEINNFKDKLIEDLKIEVNILSL